MKNKYPQSSVLLFSFALILGVFASSGLSAESATVTPAAPSSPDFGNYSSETLTTKAWQAFEAKNYALVEAYTAKCIEMYGAKAKEMQAELTAPAPVETASTMWALNDVGTCYFIRGNAFEAQGKNDKAVAAYNKLVTNFPFAQTWDTNGWFWPPAEAAKQRIKVLEFETL